MNFEKLNKIDKFLVRLIKKKRRQKLLIQVYFILFSFCLRWNCFGLNVFDNFIIVNGLNILIKRQVVRVDKIQDLIIYCLKESYFKCKGINRLKVKG